MHEDQYYNALADSAGVWRALVVVLVVSLIAFFVLRLLIRPFLDRKTRRILMEEIEEAEAEAKAEAEEQDGPASDKAS